LEESVVAQPLTPGCYTASIVAAGSASLHFWVDTMNRVRPWSGRDYDSAGGRYQQHALVSNARADSAIALCLTAYAAARSPGDSAGTDRSVPVRNMLSRRTFTCRDYRRLYWGRFQKTPWALDSTDGA
jgi:hypothetical protein